MAVVLWNVRIPSVMEPIQSEDGSGSWRPKKRPEDTSVLFTHPEDTLWFPTVRFTDVPPVKGPVVGWSRWSLLGGRMVPMVPLRPLCHPSVVRHFGGQNPQAAAGFAVGFGWLMVPL